MKANTGRKYRLYPTRVQADQLTSWSHTCRAIWNVALEQRRYIWQQRRRTLRASEQCVHLTQARSELPWMSELPAQSAQQILRHLDAAYDNWWNPAHTAAPPTRRRKGAPLRVPFPGQAVAVRKVSRRMAQVRLPKLGWIKFRLSRPLDGSVRNATVSHDGLGWHIAFGVFEQRRSATSNGLPSCGVDFGVACSAYISDETQPRLMPLTLTAGEQQRLKGLERRKARQVTRAKRHNGGRYSNRLRRTIAAIAALKARQSRRRVDWTHKLTTDLAKNHSMVAIEDLRVRSMTRSARGTVDQPGSHVRQKAGLNRSILDGSPYERRRQLEYKAPRYGSRVVAVPAPFTSQTCAACGYRDPASRPGCGREFTCTNCEHQAHADRNAARNIHAAGWGGVQHAQSLIGGEATSRTREPLGGSMSSPQSLSPSGGRGHQLCYGHAHVWRDRDENGGDR